MQAVEPEVRLVATVLPAAARSASAAVARVTACQPLGLPGQAGLQAAAVTLGLTMADLTSQIWAGASLASLAEAAGVDLERVAAAVAEATRTANRQAILRGVAAGLINQAHGRWLMEGLAAGYWGAARDGLALGQGDEHGRQVG
jgi:hypothetical protein